MLLLLLTHTGAGIFVNTGDGSVPTGVLPNNGIVITKDVTSGMRFAFLCHSGSTEVEVGQFLDPNGNSLPIGQTTGPFAVGRIGNPIQPASFLVQNLAGFEIALTAADEGVYTCHIPDENGNDVDVNIGIYRNGFNSELEYTQCDYIH